MSQYAVSPVSPHDGDDRLAEQRLAAYVMPETVKVATSTGCPAASDQMLNSTLSLPFC